MNQIYFELKFIVNLSIYVTKKLWEIMKCTHKAHLNAFAKCNLDQSLNW